MTDIQRTILDNVKNGLPYNAGVAPRTAADKTYLWLVNNGYIRDGEITPAGEAALAPPQMIEVVTLTLADGSKATYSGRVQIGETPGKVTDISVRQMPLPQGCTLDELAHARATS